MKAFKLALAAAVALAAAPAYPQGMKDMDMKAEKDAKAASHKAAGVVTKVDAAKGKVTIKHGPVESLKWPAMTMAFTVKDKAMLEKMPKGKKVEFEFQEQGKDYVITSVR